MVTHDWCGRAGGHLYSHLTPRGAAGTERASQRAERPLLRLKSRTDGLREPLRPPTALWTPPHGHLFPPAPQRARPASSQGPPPSALPHPISRIPPPLRNAPPPSAHRRFSIGSERRVKAALSNRVSAGAAALPKGRACCPPLPVAAGCRVCALPFGGGSARAADGAGGGSRSLAGDGSWSRPRTPLLPPALPFHLLRALSSRPAAVCCEPAAPYDVSGRGTRQRPRCPRRWGGQRWPEPGVGAAADKKRRGQPGGGAETPRGREAPLPPRPLPSSPAAGACGAPGAALGSFPRRRA